MDRRVDPLPGRGLGRVARLLVGKRLRIASHVARDAAGLGDPDAVEVVGARLLVGHGVDRLAALQVDLVRDRARLADRDLDRGLPVGQPEGEEDERDHRDDGDDRPPLHPRTVVFGVTGDGVDLAMARRAEFGHGFPFGFAVDETNSKDLVLASISGCRPEWPKRCTDE